MVTEFKFLDINPVKAPPPGLLEAWLSLSPEQREVGVVGGAWDCNSNSSNSSNSSNNGTNGNNGNNGNNSKNGNNGNNSKIVRLVIVVIAGWGIGRFSFRFLSGEVYLSFLDIYTGLSFGGFWGQCGSTQASGHEASY